MERYDLENRYEDDEIDLTELLKTIIKEKKIVFVITLIFTILVSGFAFYKISQPKNYGVNIVFSEDTTNKINQFNESYKNGALTFNNTIQQSFDSLLNETNEKDVVTVSSQNTKEIAQLMKTDYNFIKVIDTKNKSYKLFTKTKQNDIEKISERIIEIVNSDNETINKEFNKNFAQEIVMSENTLASLTKDTENLNKKIMTVIDKNFNDISKENMKDNLSIIAPILYVEYKEKINSLNSIYLKTIELKNIEKDSKNLLTLSGEENITVISLNSPSTSSGFNYKLIILIGAILGVFAGMFFAIIKQPLINIFKEIKEEK